MVPEPAPELWNDNIWDMLLDSLEEKCVIPVVGPDLVRVEDEGGPVPLDRYVARQLARAHRWDEHSLPAERPLNHVVSRLIRQLGARTPVCNAVFEIMKGAGFRPSRALLQLAEITDFDLFVTTTFDSLLEAAINEVCPGGTPRAKAIAYSPKRPDDLPSAKNKLAQPIVYHLMGKLSGTGTYVVSDEDVLEYVCEMQTDARRPPLLLDELKKNHLLILGTGFSDWLSRFFLRTAKGGRLSSGRESVEILADDWSHKDPGLVFFLQHFSAQTRVFRAGGAIEFVEELWRRWKERQPASAARGAVPGRLRGEPPPGAIFLSYARDDLDAVRELHAGLVAAGLPVWFDQDSLGPGDEFSSRIERYIAQGCGLFIPVISKNTDRRLEGYFRREWNSAIERDRGIHHGRTFIVPVVVDDTIAPSAVPPRFAQLHFTWLPGGRVSPMFVRELQQVFNGS